MSAFGRCEREIATWDKDDEDLASFVPVSFLEPGSGRGPVLAEERNPFRQETQQWNA